LPPDREAAPALGFADLVIDLSLFEFGTQSAPANAEVPASPLGGLVFRPALYRRNEVSWCSVRAWRSDLRRADMARFKLCKTRLEPEVIAAAAREIAELLRLLFGHFSGWLVTSVACGHSRRPDCFGKRLGRAVAAQLGAEWAEVFRDRLVAGVSHPKEFRKLPALLFAATPTAPVFVIDDLASSGWHIEEALGRIRELGLPAFGAVWIAGTVK
jgi:hypothetical protein